MTTKLEKLKAKADSCYSEKRFQDAVDVLLGIIEVESQIPDLHEKLGMSYFHLGKLNLCLEQLTKALLLDPNNPFRYASRAFVRNGLGDVDGAIEDYEKAIHLDPKDAIAHNNLGLLLEKKGFEKQAKSSFGKADNLAPDFFQNKLNNEVNDQSNVEQNDQPLIEKKETEISEKMTEVSEIQTIKKVFTSKNVFLEFLSFIKNGFKLKK